MLPIAGKALHLAAEAHLPEIQLDMVASTLVECFFFFFFFYFWSHCCAVALSLMVENMVLVMLQKTNVPGYQN